MTYNLSQIANILGVKLKANRLADASTQPQIQLLLTDSRSLICAEQTLFFAIVTNKGDGHKYIPQLYNQGVRAFVISQSHEEFRNTCPQAWFLIVSNTLDALQQVAAFHRTQFQIPVVGITGSNGKTIVKEWMYQLLHDIRSVVRSPRSYNSQIGVPLSVWQLGEEHELAIIEAGVSQPNEMERLERIIRPTIGVLTNIGTAHDSGFEDKMQKLVEKLRLFKNCDVIIYNADIPGISDALALAGVGARSMSWSRCHNDAQIDILSVQQDGAFTKVRFMCLGMDGEISIPMTDDASLENAMNCLALMFYLGISLDEIAKRMMTLAPLAMRLEVLEGKRGCLLINDVYNSDITSITAALEFQKRRSSNNLSNTLILSDIQQTGWNYTRCARKIAELCKLYHIRRYIGIGERSMNSQDVFISELKSLGYNDISTSFYATTEQLLESNELDAVANELILVKGARSYRFEHISNVLQLRRHETILEVDLDAIVHNLNIYRSKLKPNTKITCMVKAFGYGNGSYELAKTLQDQNVDYLAVAVADEGADLRRQGITTPIIVMNPEFSTFRLIVENGLEPEIYSFRILHAFVDELNRMGVTNYPIHLKIDTGMHRLGFMPNEIDALIACIRQCNAVTVRSVFSHLAGADSEEFDDFTMRQFEIFSQCADRITSSFSYSIIRHILNSAGIERFPDWQFDMCRLGIGLYGFPASSQPMELETVSTLKTTILQIKEIDDSETVGYSRKGVLSRPSRIAMIPIGYADGYDRRLGNGNASVIIAGKACPTVGNICMDVTFIDVTDCPQAQEGDDVQIFGKDMPLTEIADQLQTISYEIISTISSRVKRIYYKE